MSRSKSKNLLAVAGSEQLAQTVFETSDRTAPERVLLFFPLSF